MSSITISGLRAGYHHTPVLDDVNLAVASGTTTAILGVSGGGKTTLLRAIAGFLHPQSGRIEIGGHVLTDQNTFVAPHRRAVGYVRQDGALFPHLDVAGNITFGLSRRHRKRADTVGELLELVGLSPDLARRRPDQLSGGQQQRIALARALAPQPEVILLDEPFSSLDASLRAITRRATAAALAERAATTVLVTHDQTEALSFADQVAILRDGRLVQVGPPDQVYTAPADPDLAQFLGEAVVLPARARGAVADTALGTIDLSEPAQGAVVIVLRPEQILLAPDPGHGHPAAATGVVAEVTYYGHDAMVELDLVPTAVRILVRISGTPIPPLGTRTGLRVGGTAKAFPCEKLTPGPQTAQPAGPAAAVEPPGTLRRG